MKAIIGIDAATGLVAVAAARGDQLLREVEHEPDESGHPRHSELLLREVAGCVDTAGGWEQVGLIAVGLGPGSFTGLRIGVATARGLAQARALPLAGIGSLAALARGIRESAGGGERASLPLIDARRGQVFAALHGPTGEEIWPPTVLSPEQLTERVRGLESTPLAAGDGSLRFRQELESAGAEVAGPDDPVHRLSARHVCALARDGSTSPPDRIEPIYLRAPDAEKWLERDNPDTGV